MQNEKSAIIKFSQLADQEIDGIKKLSGFVKVRNLIPVIDILDLEANPRSAKVGQVTNDIQDSLESTPSTFPFKTKGILLATASYEKLERNRYRLSFDDTETEGILDGGHNTLAIGLFILEHCFEYAEEEMPKIKSWTDFKECWHTYHHLIEEYREFLRENSNDQDYDDMDTYVPIELLIPTDQVNAESFRLNLFDICEARNNNVQLTVGTKANQVGYFDDLKSTLKRTNEDLFNRIEWKLNGGGDIKVENFIALTWIPLTLLCPVQDDKGKNVDAPAPSQLYSGKGNALKSYERFMSSPSVTFQPENYEKKELRNQTVSSAFEVAAELPDLYDYIYENFGDLYNRAGGSYGSIGAVRKLNSRRKKVTPFGKKEIEKMCPDGYIAPLAYGLQELMHIDETGGTKLVKWKVPPMPWLKEHLPQIIEEYKEVLEPMNYDPQKVGKSSLSYTTSLRAYKLAYLETDPDSLTTQ